MVEELLLMVYREHRRLASIDATSEARESVRFEDAVTHQAVKCVSDLRLSE